MQVTRPTTSTSLVPAVVTLRLSYLRWLLGEELKRYILTGPATLEVGLLAWTSHHVPEARHESHLLPGLHFLVWSEKSLIEGCYEETWQPYLYVPAPGHLHEVFVLLQGLVHFVICHAVATEPSFPRVVHLGKNDKLGHVGNCRELFVQESGEMHGLRSPRTV